MPNAKVVYSVLYRDADSEKSAVIARFDDVIKACSLALNIHQFSNVTHEIRVISIDDVVLTITSE